MFRTPSFIKLISFNFLLLFSIVIYAENVVDEVRSQVFDDRIYVFTPNGEVIDLPAQKEILVKFTKTQKILKSNDGITIVVFY